MTETNPITANEFTDVITESSTIPNISPNSPEFVTVTTETVIVSSSSESSENDFDSPENLIKRYDELFDKQEEYSKFIKQKLANFEKTIELQLFDLHYNRHRNETHNIRTKRNTAQKLLEEADQMQKEHDQRQKQFLRFIATMTRQNLKRKLYKPTKIDEDQAHPRLERRAQLLPTPSTSQTLNNEQRAQNFIINSPFARTARTNNTLMREAHHRHMSTTPRKIYKCFKCDSIEHLMYHCPQYRCRICRRLAPGHRFAECPLNHNDPIEEMAGYHDVEGFHDGNLEGEN